MVGEQVVPVGAVQEEDRGSREGDDDEQGADVGAFRSPAPHGDIRQADDEGQGQVHLQAVDQVEPK